MTLALPQYRNKVFKITTEEGAYGLPCYIAVDNRGLVGWSSENSSPDWCFGAHQHWIGENGWIKPQYIARFLRPVEGKIPLENK